MRLFDRTLSAVLETEEQPTAVYSKPVDVGADTRTFNQAVPNNNNGMGTVQQWRELEKAREQAKAAKMGTMNIDQKIDFALKQAENAERIAHQTANAVMSIDFKLDKAFHSLTNMINKINHGKSTVDQDPPGSSIFGDDHHDPESVI